MKALFIICQIGCLFLSIKAGLVEHPRYKEIRGIRVRDAVEENFELAQCYEVFANNGNEKIDKSVDRSEQCLVESEARRSALHEDTREKDKLESKIERLEVRFEVCSDMEVSDYFNCHASNAPTYKSEMNSISSDAKVEAANRKKRAEVITYSETKCLNTVNSEVQHEINKEIAILNKCIVGKK